jgi:hypothetical protein
MRKKIKWMLHSKTFWANVLGLTIIVSAYFGVTPDYTLIETATEVYVGLLPLLNIVLRKLTKEPVSW